MDCMTIDIYIVLKYVIFEYISFQYTMDWSSDDVSQTSVTLYAMPITRRDYKFIADESCISFRFVSFHFVCTCYRMRCCKPDCIFITRLEAKRTEPIIKTGVSFLFRFLIHALLFLHVLSSIYEIILTKE